MIENINQLERGKNYMVEIRELGLNPINFIGRFRPGRYWPLKYIPDGYFLGFEIMYYCDYQQGLETFSEWKPWNRDVEGEVYGDICRMLTKVRFNDTYKIYSLGPSGQLITPTTPPNQVPEIAHLISGNDPKTKFSKLPKEATDNIKSFLGGKIKSRRKSRRSRRSKKTRKYKRK